MIRSKPLSRTEIELWQAWLRATEAIAARVSGEVARACGISASEYAILTSLAASDNGRLRQRDLAIALGWDKSRISHQLTRMQERGLLARTKTPEDGSRVTIARAGREALERARPIHARAVRRHLIERLTPEQAETIRTLGI